MIYITQFIYIKPGEEETFEQFESVAIPLVAKYNGRMLYRIRPDENAFVSAEEERPYEIHLAVFETEQDFLDYSNDAERKSSLHLKEKAVRSTLSIKGIKFLLNYSK
jgi:hypothetical protein